MSEQATDNNQPGNEGGGDNNAPSIPEHIASIEGLSDAERRAIATAESRGIRFQIDGQNVGNEPPADEGASREQPKERPANVPEKFWDAEKGEVRVDELGKSFQELEREFHKRQNSNDKDADGAKNSDGNDADGAENDSAPTGDLGERINTVLEQYSESGEVTDEMVSQLTEAGLPEENVQLYFQGLQAMQELAKQKAFSAVGGEDNWNAMTEWAKANLSEQEQNAFDRMVVDPDQSEFAIQGLWNRYARAEGTTGEFISRDSASSSGPSGDTYSGKTEMLADIRDKRYRTDPAFREQVAAKIERSERAGTVAIHATRKVSGPAKG